MSLKYEHIQRSNHIFENLTVAENMGLAILIIDKNIEALMAIADRHYFMEKGRIVWSGTTEELQSRPELKSRYLGVEC